MTEGINLNKNWIFKYGPINHLEDTLIKNTLGFSRVSALNDPFEIASMAEIYMTGNSKEDRNEKSRIFHNEKNDFLNNSQISCFSRTPNEPLMWSHYSDKHYGVCYCFDELELTIYDGLTAYFGDVIYSSHLPEIYYKEGSTTTVQWNRELFRVLMTKSLNWVYEKEVRVIREKNAVNTFRPQSLKAIIIGHNASIWNKNRVLEIITKANDSRDQKIEIYYACLGTRNFEIFINDKRSSSLAENTRGIEY